MSLEPQDCAVMSSVPKAALNSAAVGQEYTARETVLTIEQCCTRRCDDYFFHATLDDCIHNVDCAMVRSLLNITNLQHRIQNGEENEPQLFLPPSHLQCNLDLHYVSGC